MKCPIVPNEVPNSNLFESPLELVSGNAGCCKDRRVVKTNVAMPHISCSAVIS